MLTDPKDTLGYQASRVLFQNRDMSGVPCAHVALALKPVFSGTAGNHLVPEQAALSFYCGNHGMAGLLAEYEHPLQKLKSDDLEFVNEYVREANWLAMAGFTYLLMICIRESRHLQNAKQFRLNIEETTDKVTADFIASVPDDAAAAQTQFLTNTPKCSLGNLLTGLVFCFAKGGWGGGYGGKKWALIAQTGLDFVNGKTTAEMMLDTLWTLAHNGGPIWNKGQIFHPHTSDLAKILDVQRAGQIPQMIVQGTHLKHKSATVLTKKWADFVVARFKIEPTVNWALVKKLGALGDYEDLIKKQTVDTGEGLIEVMPNEFVSIFKMKRAA